MAIPTELGVSFTPTEVASMKAAAKIITDLIRSKKSLNLSNDEKKGELSTVSDERAPFVIKSIADYGLAYPNLNGLAYKHDLALKDLSTFRDLFELQTAMAEANEVVDEMRLVAGHFCFKFMNDQYYNAKRYLGDDVPGAQIVYDGLKGCFEGQGSNNPTQGNNPSTPSSNDTDNTQP